MSLSGFAFFCHCLTLTRQSIVKKRFPCQARDDRENNFENDYIEDNFGHYIEGKFWHDIEIKYGNDTDDKINFLLRQNHLTLQRPAQR